MLNFRIPRKYIGLTSSHKKSRNKSGSFKWLSYIGGSVFVLSGGVVVLLVSAVCWVVSVVVVDVVVPIAVESAPVLSDDPDRFLVELHADVANIIEPATARLKIIFFIN